MLLFYNSEQQNVEIIKPTDNFHLIENIPTLSKEELLESKVSPIQNTAPNIEVSSGMYTCL